MWYFDRKLNRNADELKKLRAEKKKVIEQVKNKLAYNVVQDILNRFDDTVTQQAPINARKMKEERIRATFEEPFKSLIVDFHNSQYQT